MVDETGCSTATTCQARIDTTANNSAFDRGKLGVGCRVSGIVGAPTCAPNGYCVILAFTDRIFRPSISVRSRLCTEILSERGGDRHCPHPLTH
ncbi:MAG: hypothetical protein ACP5D7_02500 [Limnospira sp.]